MIQPIRPQDAGGIYQRQVTQGESAREAGSADARRLGAAANGRRTDRVTLSEGARSFARVMDAVQQAPDTRADRVDELRGQIESGEYEVNHFQLARLLADRGLGS